MYKLLTKRFLIFFQIFMMYKHLPQNWTGGIRAGVPALLAQVAGQIMHLLQAPTLEDEKSLSKLVKCMAFH